MFSAEDAEEKEMKKIFVFITFPILMLFLISALTDESKTKSMGELSKEIVNLLVPIWNLPFIYNYSNIGRNLVDGVSMFKLDCSNQSCLSP